ncbi:hypothetical protein VT930_11920 [Mycobacterium sherrisii]|uniref:phage fiber-tail adaptor protein n=1 Tax=Mycobacterium sherrisii TaxID=243061 RepID=UPI002DDCA5C5|nr:hypothetical protein [Mycobacterium sherrisii]MEC4763811.1 hypothetical protein [Mycobacterium sherrisii]
MTATKTGMEGLAYPPYQPTPGRYSQGVYEVLDYPIDWSDWVPVGDAIVSSSWTVVATWPQETAGLAALTITDGGYTSTSATVWVSDGDAGSGYEVMNLVTTRGGRKGQRVLEFHIKGNLRRRHECLSGHGVLTAVTSAVAA